MLGIVGKKVNQTQKFLEDGTRIPVTQVSTGGNVVVSLKTSDKDSYNAVQIGFGIRKNFNKAILGHTKKAGMEKPSRFLREIRVWNTDESPLPEIGSQIKAEDVLKPGDIVDVTGKSKGKGYAGVVKRHHFKGGPRTHGQSDRERAPGSIGQTTTPGRVYKGKRMAGRMGNTKATLKNLVVIDVSGDDVFIKGLVPGSLNSLVVIRKTGESKKFVPLYKEISEEEKVSAVPKGEEKSLEKPATIEDTEKSTEAIENTSQSLEAKPEASSGKTAEEENKEKKSSEARSGSAGEEEENAS